MTEFVRRRRRLRILTRAEHTYRHELGAGADKLSEAEQEVLFSGENLGQLEKEMMGKWE